MKKEIREIVKQIEANGFEVVQRRKYLHVTDERGNLLARLPSTPSGGRWKKNLLAELRRKGIL